MGTRVQALMHARHLPEAGAAAVWRDLEAHIGRGRAHGRVVHGDGEVDVARHGPSWATPSRLAGQPRTVKVCDHSQRGGEWRWPSLPLTRFLPYALRPPP